MNLVYLTVVLFTAFSATTHASCIKPSETDNGWVDCYTNKPAKPPEPLTPESARRIDMCLQGVRAATEAYKMVVVDAGNPPINALYQATVFRLSQQPFPANRGDAGKALKFITMKLLKDGVRAPDEILIDNAAHQFAVEECQK